MVLFFSLAAVMTLRGFAYAEDISRQKSTLESAMVVTQNAAELLKSTGGDFVGTAEKMAGIIEEGRLIIRCSSEGQPAAEADRYGFSVIAEPIPSENPLLESAHIKAVFEDEIILAFDVSWQRGTSHGS